VDILDRKGQLRLLREEIKQVRGKTASASLS